MQFLNEDDGLGSVQGWPTRREEKTEELPQKGDICAVVASDSTDREPKIFMARVIRLEGEDAVLHCFEPIGDDLYKPVIGSDSTWREKSHCIIWPLDISYRREERAYRLNTSIKEIHNSLKTQ